MRSAPFARLFVRPASRPRNVISAPQDCGFREVVAIAEVIGVYAFRQRRAHVEMRASSLVKPIIPFGLKHLRFPPL
jgi:hypothetical protein